MTQHKTCSDVSPYLYDVFLIKIVDNKPQSILTSQRNYLTDNKINQIINLTNIRV